MSATIIDGKHIAVKLKNMARDRLVPLLKDNFHPCLSVILAGEDAASQVYVRQKEKACREVGLISRVIRLPECCTQTQLNRAVQSQVNDADVAGVLVQLPLPKHLNAQSALSLVPAYKDVDGFSHFNFGMLWKGESANHVACTPAGVMFMLKELDISLAGKHVVIVGRGNTVGKPLAALCLAENATVTICHSKTKNLTSITKQADVLISAVGKPHLVTADMVKPGAVVVDVGINKVDGKLCGDVDFDNVKAIASYITPVPGGVGPLTVAQLVCNTANAARVQYELFTRRKEVSQWVGKTYLSQEINTETTTTCSASSADAELQRMT